MEEPPDPGGTAPPAACFVTIPNESVIVDDMDIETPLTNEPVESQDFVIANKRKRNRTSTKASNSQSGMKDIVVEKQNMVPPPVETQVENPKENSNSNEKPPNFIPIGRTQYDATDSSPYIVHVQREQSSPNDGSILHPISFGRFLKKHFIKNIINGSVKCIGRNRITLSFSNHNDANSFVNHNSLATEKLKAFIPTFTITRMGLVRGVPTEWSPEEIIDNVSVPSGCGKILKVRRLNYKVNIGGSPTWKPSQTVVITFDGKTLPKRIYICYNALAVELYTFPTIQCFSCCRFGHTKLQCRSKPRCYKCGQEHTGDTCNWEEDCATCCLCSGLHYATNKSCPEFVRQKSIKLSMAENCISYAEAFKLHPPTGKSYAEVLSSTKPTSIEKPILLSSQSSSRTSYRKTLTSKPRSPYNAPKGYDRVAHQEFSKDYNMPTGSNGCAYPKPNQNDPEQFSQHALTEIIASLIDILTQNNILLPSNVAPILESLKKRPRINRSEINTFRIITGQSDADCPVELPQCSQQEK